MEKRPNTLTVKLTLPKNKSQKFFSNKWAIGASAVIGSALILKDTFFVHWNRRLQEKKSNKDKTVIPVSENVLTLVQRVMEDLQFPEDEKKLVGVIAGTSFRTKTFGSTDTIFGAYLAIPEHFNSANPKEECAHIFPDEIIDIVLSSDKVTSLRGQLELSENAKLYSIARELTKARSCVTYVTQGLLAAFLSYGSLFGYMSLDRAFLSWRPLSVKMPVLFLCLTIGGLIYEASFTYVCACEDENAEQLVCCLGETYVAGGIEFCEKALQRNAILDEIFEGASSCFEGRTALSMMPYSDRLALLKEKENCKR